jgi:hypothetical protein
MKVTCLVAVLALLVSVPVFADDQAKAQKQLERITAMASDLTGRRVVGIMMADLLNAKRLDLVSLRKKSNLNYGSLFLAQQLTALGMSAEELAGQLKSGKNIFEVANSRNIDWKQVLSDAKKLNGKVDRHLFEYFFDSRPDRQRDKDEGYNVLSDSVNADEQVSPEAIDAASDAFVRARDMAMQRPGRHAEQGLNATDELQFRRDHARSGAPTPSDVGMSTTAPK